MTPSRDDIIRMARDAGVSIDSFAVRRNEAISFTPKALERFAALVVAAAVAAEREACALDIEAMEHGNVRTCAAAIRARGAL